MGFNTYIDDRLMIPILLAYDWMIQNNTWTDCRMRLTNQEEGAHRERCTNLKGEWVNQGASGDSGQKISV